MTGIATVDFDDRGAVRLLRGQAIRVPARMVIEGTSALVAGGASGLGAATARRLHAEGASVVIADLNAEKGAALAAELGERARSVEANVLEADGVQSAVDAAAALDGGLRISVCCAGIGWAERTASKRGPHDLEIFSNVVKVNLIGTFNVLRLAATAMSENEPTAEGERGVCINTASIAAFEGQIGQVAYAASKGGIVSLTLPAARDLAGRGVRVVTIAPGLFDTPLLAALPEEQREALGAGIPFPSRLGRPEEYADLAAAVVANPMLNGETIRLDGALRMPPR
jgi:3-hydroxyacyl-CoA dehydrogenase / 3-hydroxy-2-methylbutyryl-CoA dehydrogenase